MTKMKLNRRKLLTASTTAGLAAAFGMPLLSKEAMAQAAGKEYVFLSIVTQVPFWVDYRNAMKDLEDLMGIKATFTGPLDFDTAAQARQLDELIARRPAGIMIFPGDPATLAPGVERAVAAGIPVTCCIGDIPDSPRSTFLGINGVQAGRVGGEMLAQAKERLYLVRSQRPPPWSASKATSRSLQKSTQTSKLSMWSMTRQIHHTRQPLIYRPFWRTLILLASVAQMATVAKVLRLL